MTKRSRAGFGLAWAVAMLLASGRAAAAAPPPNVVVILADDLGYSDVGSFGGEIATPELDRLAAEGVRFTHFYNTARCSPTRAALLTGVYPHEAGMGFLPHDWWPPGYTGELAEDVPTLPERLREAGYASYVAGKWHLSNQVGYWDGDPERTSTRSWPLARGFERFYGTLAGAGNYFFPPTLVRDETPVRMQELASDYYYTDAISDAAATFVREHAGRAAGKPFFLYVAYTAPHWPLHARPEDVARYEGRYDAGWDALRAERLARMRELGVVDPDWPLSPRDPGAPAWEAVAHKAWQARRMEVYAAQVHAMDRGIGRVLAALDEAGLRDETWVFFLSDNGASAEELGETPAWLERALGFPFRGVTRGGGVPQRGNDPAHLPGPESTYQSYGLGWANASNTPFRLYKQQVHEGGIATPLIVRGPDLGVQPGAILREPGHVVDLAPTILELAGLAPGAVRGESLAPQLHGRSRDRAAIFWEHQGNRALLDGRWKLVSRWRPGAVPGSRDWELYDLASDRTELHDLGESQPERARAMREAWERTARDTNVGPWPWVARPLRRASGLAAALLGGVALAVLLAARARRRRARGGGAGG